MMPKKSDNPTLTNTGSTEILDAALEYLDRGFSVIPCGQNKKPLIVWKEFQSRRPSTDEVESWWRQWPDANVAIVCGQISGIYCVDADGGQGVNWMRENLPTTGVYSQTAKGAHAIYLIPLNAVIKNYVRIHDQVDIRGEGGYFVAPPSIHESGHVYEWHFLMGGWDDLAEYQPPSTCRASKKCGPGNLNIDLSRFRSSPINQPVDQGERNNTLAQLAGKWIGVGLDLAEATILAESWNQKNNPPLGEKELRKTVESIFKTHLTNHPSDIKITDKIEIALPEKQEKKDHPFAESVLNPGGLLQELMQFIHNASPVSVPVFELAGAISCVGTLIGQKFMTESGLRTNFYCVALGHAGAGKDAPQSALSMLIKNSKARDIFGPNDLASNAALFKLLTMPHRRRTLLMIDEFGLIIQALKRPNSHLHGLLSTFMKLFSATDRSYEKEYAGDNDVIIPWHHVSFYGASTPNRFWENFSSDEATDGFLARLLVFESRHGAQEPKDFVSSTPPQALINQIEEFESIKTTTRGGNLENIPVPKEIGKKPDAQKYFNEWRSEIIKRQRGYQKHGHESFAAILSRAAEHAHKLALVHAVSSQGPGLLKVRLNSVEWAIELIESHVNHFISQIEDNIAQNEFHGFQQKIIRTIKRISTVDRPGASIREIYQNVRGNPKQIDELIKSLTISGEIVQQDYKPKRGPASVIYCIAQQKPVDNP